MSLDPLFSLSPLNSRSYTYDAANPNSPYVDASLYTYGGRTADTGIDKIHSLSKQYSNDQVLLSHNPVKGSYKTMAGLVDDVFRRCAVLVTLHGTNVSAANQYLLIFRLARAFGSPIAQFFIGVQLVRVEALSLSSYDDIAILLDVPDNNSDVHLIVRLAHPEGTSGGTSYYHGFFFKGIDCYLL